MVRTIATLGSGGGGSDDSSNDSSNDNWGSVDPFNITASTDDKKKKDDDSGGSSDGFNPDSGHGTNVDDDSEMSRGRLRQKVMAQAKTDTANSDDSGGSSGDKKNKNKKKNKTAGQKAHDALTGAYDTGAGFADWAAGNTDESVARSTDDKKGGGWWAGTKETGGAIDSGTRKATDAALDNDTFSIQDTGRGAAETALEVATGDRWNKQKIAEAYGETTSKLAKGGASVTEDTAAETVTDPVGSLINAAAVKPAEEIFVTSTTGLKSKKDGSATAEGTVGAEAVSEVALAAATGGTGNALKTGGKGVIKGLTQFGDEAAYALRGGDSATEGARAQDAVNLGQESTDTATDANRAEDAADSTEDAADYSTDWRGRVTRNGETVGDTSTVGTALGLGEDATGGTFDTLRSNRLTRLLNRGEDGADTATDANRAEDAADSTDTATDANRAEETTDTATNLNRAEETTDAANAAEEATDTGNGLLNTLRANRGKLAAAGTFAGTTGAIALSDLPSNFSTANGENLTGTKTYEPTDKHPNGGRLFSVSKNGEQVGYWTVVGVRGNNLVVLDNDGTTRKAKISRETFRKLVGGGR